MGDVVKLLLSLMCLASTVLAVWSSNPAINLQISPGDIGSVSPLIALGNEGDCYIAWFEQSGDALDVRLQRFDLLGNPLWGADGVLVMEAATGGEVYIWDLETGPDGTVYLVTPVGLGNGLSLRAWKLSKSGAMLWGDSGVLLADSTSGWNAAFPCILADASGGAYISWTNEGPDSSFTYVQRLSAAGAPAWSSPVLFEPDSAGHLCCEATLCPVGGVGDFAVVTTVCTPDYWNKRMYATALSPAGEAVWSSAAIITDTREVLQQSIMPPPHPDGEGGFYITWPENTAGGQTTVLVQHVDADGTLRMPAGGAPVSSLSSMNHIEPYLAAAESGAYVFWTMLSAGQTHFAVCSQLLDPEGAPLWPASGKIIIPLQTLGLTVAGVSTDGINGFAVIDEEISGGGPSDYRAILIAPDGNPVWSGSRKDFATGGHLRETPSLSDLCWGQQWLGVWTDDRNGSSQIFAQNILTDGTLGIGSLGIGGREPEPGRIGISPNPFGASATLSVLLDTACPVSLRLYDLSGRCVLSSDFGSLPAGHHDLSLIPGDAPSGIYIATVTMGDSVVSGRCILVR
jgi:hypothetical protein